MKKTLIVLLAVLMVATMALGLAACSYDCSKDGHKWDNGEQVTAATCTDKAVYKYTCSVCKETENRPVGNPLGHDYETGWTYTDGTGHYHVCKNDSTHKTEKVAHVYDQDGNTKCVCGASKPVEACTHTGMTHEEAKAATCASTGNVEYWHCATCNKYFNSAAATTELDYDTEVVIAINPDAHDYDMESWDYTDGTGHYHVCNNFAGHHTDTVAHTLVYTNNEGDTHDEACSACEYSATGVTHVYDQSDNKCACGAENPDVEPGCSCPNCECGSCDDCDNCSCPNCGNGGGGDEPCEHPGIAKTEAKAATCSSIGYKVDFWYCEDCGNYYDSEEAINELDYDDDILIAINDQAHNYGEEWYYDGADGHYHKCSYNEAHTSTPVAHAVNSYVDNGNGTHKEVCVCEYAINDSVDHTLNYTNKTDDTHDEACEHCDYSATNVTHVYNQDDDKCLCGQDKPVEVSEIHFYDAEGNDTVTTYYVNVMNGTWACDILAKVNADATNQGITYALSSVSTASTYVSIDGTTVTATQLGAYKVIATATGDSSKTAEATIVFYSNGMFLSGNHNGWKNTNVASGDILDADDDTNTKFSITIAYSAEESFQIYDGNRNWEHVLDATFLATPGEGNLWLNVGKYTITVTLTEAGPVVTTASAGTAPSVTLNIAGSSETLNAAGSKGSYSVTKMFEANANDTFTITLTGFTSSSITVNDITKFSGDGASYITYSGSAFTVNAKAKYTLVITCDEEGNYSVAVSAEIVNESSWESNSTYTVSGLYVDYGAVTLGSITCYYDSANSQYKVCGSISVTTAGSWFNMGLYQGSSWKKDIQPKTVVSDTIGFTNTTNSISATSGYTTFGASATGTFYFELVFKADLTYVSMSWATTAFGA